MGRGRAKAKQTKVARELKYSSPQTDFTRLQRELCTGLRVTTTVNSMTISTADTWARRRLAALAGSPGRRPV